MNQTDQINAIFQQYLGRAPSPQELQGFTQAMQQGELDPITMTMFIQSTSEYQQKQIPQQAQQYASQLQPLLDKSSQNQMNKGYDAAVGRYAAMGRPDSTGLASSFAQVSGDIAANNSGLVAQQVGGYLGGAYGGNTQTQQGSAGIYPSQYNRVQGQNFQASQAALDRQAYADYYNQAQKQAKQNQWFQLGGSLLGAGSKLGAAAIMAPVA